MQFVDGQVQHYDWGHTTAIPHLLGHEPDVRPWAALWFGTPEGAPSALAGGRSLESVVGPLP